MELRRIGAVALGGLVLGLGLDVPPASATLAPGASMQVNPTSTTPGSTVTVSGSGCLGNYEIQVRLDQGLPVATSGDPSDDSWSVQLPVPAATAPGSHQITATCDSYDNVDHYAPVTLTVVAAATSTSTTSTTSPSGASAAIGVRSVPQGGTFDFQGGGFNPGETVDVTIFSDPVKVASVTANASGSVSGRATVPTSVDPGTHRLELKGASSGKVASVTFTVSAAGTAAVAAAGAGLPDTGSSSTGPTSVAAMSALVVGAILVITAARVRTGAMASIAAAQAQARAEHRPLPSSAIALATVLVGVGLARSRKTTRSGRSRS